MIAFETGVTNSKSTNLFLWASIPNISVLEKFTFSYRFDQIQKVISFFN